MKIDDKIQSFLNKVKAVEKGHKLDLSSGEDLSIGIMNLIALEEHFFFTYNKTGDKKNLEFLDQVRKMRVELLKKIIKDYGGEEWCISKHLLAAAMRLMEVGTKDLKSGNTKEAEDLFKKSYDLYNLFWGINLKLVTSNQVSDDSDKIDEKTKDEEEDRQSGEEIRFINDAKRPKVVGKSSVFAKLGDIVKKAVNCCKE